MGSINKQKLPNISWHCHLIKSILDDRVHFESERMKKNLSMRISFRISYSSAPRLLRGERRRRRRRRWRWCWTWSSCSITETWALSLHHPPPPQYLGGGGRRGLLLYNCKPNNEHTQIVYKIKHLLSQGCEFANIFCGSRSSYFSQCRSGSSFKKFTSLHFICCYFPPWIRIHIY